MGVWVLQNKELPDVETCRGLLDRVLASPQLKRSARMRELLAYVGRRALEDGCEQLREQEIGAEVFGRPPVYDTSVDNIVRVNATELRKRIEAYFESDGRHEELIMEIPRGSYLPVFRHRPVESQIVSEPASPALLPVQELPEPLPAVPAPSQRQRNGWWIAAAAAAGLVSVALACACLYLWMQNRAMHRLLYPWQYKPAVAALWTGFLSSNPTTDVVLADTAFGMFQTLSKHSYSLEDYLNSRSLLDSLPAHNESPQMQSALTLIARRTLVSRGGFSMAQHLEALEPLSNRIHMYFARTYLPALIKRDNVILFGTHNSNPWMELFDRRLNFVLERNPAFDKLTGGNPATKGVPHEVVTNKTPRAGEQPLYTPSSSMGYCTAAYLPNPDHNGRVLLIEGTSSDAAEGCCDFLLSEPGMATLQKDIGASSFPYFQVLLRTSQVMDTPMSSTIVAYRTFANLH